MKVVAVVMAEAKEGGGEKIAAEDTAPNPLARIIRQKPNAEDKIEKSVAATTGGTALNLLDGIIRQRPNAGDKIEKSGVEIVNAEALVKARIHQTQAALHGEEAVRMAGDHRCLPIQSIKNLIPWNGESKS